MVGYEITVNGQRLCIAGVGENGVLTAAVSWVGKQGEAGHFHMHTGGIDSNTDENVRWYVPELKIGDEVSIRIYEIDGPDPQPLRYKRTSAEEPRRAE
jgi:hypothetical protein